MVAPCPGVKRKRKPSGRRYGKRGSAEYARTHYLTGPKAGQFRPGPRKTTRRAGKTTRRAGKTTRRAVSRKGKKKTAKNGGMGLLAKIGIGVGAVAAGFGVKKLLDNLGKEAEPGAGLAAELPTKKGLKETVLGFWQNSPVGTAKAAEAAEAPLINASEQIAMNGRQMPTAAEIEVYDKALASLAEMREYEIIEE